MTPQSSPRHPLLLLGRDHEEYGRFTTVRVSDATTAVISPGADADFAARQAKRHVNEDAILVHEDSRHTVVCVADAHFGREASEELLARLATELLPVPENPERLDAVLDRLARGRPGRDSGSETTLTILILDRLFRQAFGVSFGDSSIVLAPDGEVPQRENAQSPTFVTLARPASLAPGRASHFAFSPSKGDLLLAFTDGIDECCYRDPDRSISPEIMGDLIGRAGREPEAVARALTELALRGVGGSPGGQDNIALVVTRA